MTRTVGTVEDIWRYPVKSLGGERLTSVDVETRGLAGDRQRAVRDADGGFGSGKTTRRFRRMAGLLRLSARDTGGVPQVCGPDGEPVADACLRANLGRDDIGLAAEARSPTSTSCRSACSRRPHWTGYARRSRASRWTSAASG